MAQAASEKLRAALLGQRVAWHSLLRLGLALGRRRLLLQMVPPPVHAQVQLPVPSVRSTRRLENAAAWALRAVGMHFTVQQHAMLPNVLCTHIMSYLMKTVLE